MLSDTSSISVKISHLFIIHQLFLICILFLINAIKHSQMRSYLIRLNMYLLISSCYNF